MGRANPNIILLILLIVPEPREPKITKLNIPILVNEDIGALQVAVEHIFAMQVGHPKGDILADIEYFLLVQLLASLVQVIEQTSPREEFRYHDVFVVVDAHAHVQHYARVKQLVYHLYLLDEVTHVPVSEPLLLCVLLYRHVLAQPSAQVNLPVAALSDGFYDLDLLLRDKEGQPDPFLHHIALDLPYNMLSNTLHVHFSSFLTIFLELSVGSCGGRLISFSLFGFFLVFLVDSILDFLLLQISDQLQIDFAMEELRNRIPNALALEDKLQEINFLL